MFVNDDPFFRASDEDISSFDLVTEKNDRRAHVADLVQTIKDTADKLAVDGSTRGDLKILSRTLRELRYAFKVFAPYRRKRKVTVDDWVRVFKRKRAEIAAAHCPA